MNALTDIALRQADVLFFEDAVSDVKGQDLRMYSVVKPLQSIVQYYADGDPPITIAAGSLLVIIGRSEKDRNLLWLEVDSVGEFSGANICLAADQLEYFCEVGDDIYLKGNKNNA